MRAMRLEAVGEPLAPRDLPDPEPRRGELLIRVHACGVCRTDLHLVDGEVVPAVLPITPGHEVVGDVVESRAPNCDFRPGDRVGVPWLAWTCGECAACARGDENLCDRARFTGHGRDGGYATHVTADARYCLSVPTSYSAVEAAPLLCAGLIGYRSCVMAGDAERLGLYGFGAAAHIVAQVARAEGAEVYAFTRPGDRDAQRLAVELGARWAGASTDTPPQPLDAAILYAPVGALVPQALAAVRPGGSVVCAGIHMSDIPSFPYDLLWGERRLLSVANLTRADGRAFMDRAARQRIETRVSRFELGAANEALGKLRGGEIHGAAVLVPDGLA